MSTPRFIDVQGIMEGWGDVLNGMNEAQFMLARGLATAIVTVLLVFYGNYKIWYWMEQEQTIKYTVSPPKIPADAKVLEQPAVKVGGTDPSGLSNLADEYQQVPGSTAIQCYAPATGRFLGLVNPTSPAGIDRAIEQAKDAQKKWEKTTFAQRRQVLRTLLKFVLENQEEICRIACIDSGKTMIDAALGEILTTVEKLQWTIKHGEKALRPSKRPTNFLMKYKSNTVEYEPLGVVAALVSWNYPFHNLMGPIISSIFAGNGIIVKASENTAWSSYYFTTIARGALSVHGHDQALIQSIVTWPQTASHLTSHPLISHITFIGSRPVAHKVATSAAKALIPVVAELGGKDAAIVLDSAVKDLPRITETLLRGTFQSAGQNCIGIERIIACPKTYDILVSKLEPRIKALRVGSGLDAVSSDSKTAVDVGAMISTASFDRLESLIASAVASGARLLAGGKRYHHPVHKSGHYFQPTLLVDVTPSMAISSEECFAPICVLMRASSAENAVQIANHSPNFGLGASVFGKPSWELEAVVRNLKVGMVAVNDFGVTYAVQLPFGGVRGSGYGKFAGEEGLRGVSVGKSVTRDRWDWMGIRTSIPSPVRYPIRDLDKGGGFVRGIIELGYGGVWDMVGGLIRMAKNSW